MARKVSHHFRLANENCLLKQKYTELTEKIQLLEEEIQELREQSGVKNNSHANTLFFLQNKNSELSKALLEKTKDNMKLQTQIYSNTPTTKTPYNNGDYLSDDESEDFEEREIPPQPMPPITIKPAPLQPKDIEKSWGRHRWGRHHWGRHHWGHHGGYPYYFPFRDDYRDISGNMPYPINYQPIQPINKPPKYSLKDFVNPLLSFEEFERAYNPPLPPKPTHFIPPAIQPKEE